MQVAESRGLEILGERVLHLVLLGPDAWGGQGLAWKKGKDVGLGERRGDGGKAFGVWEKLKKPTWALRLGSSNTYEAQGPEAFTGRRHQTTALPTNLHPR